MVKSSRIFIYKYHIIIIYILQKLTLFNNICKEIMIL